MTSSFTTFILFHFLSSSLIITASRRVSSPSAPVGAGAPPLRGDEYEETRVTT